MEERIFTFRLRQAIIKRNTPWTRRKNRAIKYIKEKIGRSFHVDVKNVKLDTAISNKIFSVGWGKLPSKIKLRAVKDQDIVRVELLENEGKSS